MCRYADSLEDTPPYAPDATALLQRLDILAGRVHNLSVYVKYSDQSLNLGTDESYSLHVSWVARAALVCSASVVLQLRLLVVWQSSSLAAADCTPWGGL